MKKLVILLVVALMLQSCYRPATFSRTATGMWTGATLGGSLGGLMGGRRGHHMGTVVGLIAGAAAGMASAQAAERRYDDYVNNYNRSSRSAYRDANRQQRSEVIERDDYQGEDKPYRPLVLRNLRFIDDGGNQTVNRDEDGKIIFELSNPTDETLYDVVPYVYEVNGNSHIVLSPSTRIEVVKPGDVVRYTCSLHADKKLSAGTLTFRIAVAYGESDFVTLRDFSLPSAK